MVRGPVPNRSVKEFDVELSLCMSTFTGIPSSFDHCVELRFSHAQRCQPLKCGSRFHCVCHNPRHQSLRALSRDWVAIEIVVHEDCEFVNVVLSSESYCSFGSRQDTLLHACRIVVVRSSSGPTVLLSPPSVIGLGPNMEVSLHLLSSISDSFYRQTPTSHVIWIVVHSLSLMMAGECLQPSSMSKNCPV